MDMKRRANEPNDDSMRCGRPKKEESELQSGSGKLPLAIVFRSIFEGSFLDSLLLLVRVNPFDQHQKRSANLFFIVVELMARSVKLLFSLLLLLACTAWAHTVVPLFNLSSIDNLANAHVVVLCVWHRSTQRRVRSSWRVKRVILQVCMPPCSAFPSKTPLPLPLRPMLPLSHLLPISPLPLPISPLAPLIRPLRLLTLLLVRLIRLALVRLIKLALVRLVLLAPQVRLARPTLTRLLKTTRARWRTLPRRRMRPCSPMATLATAPIPSSSSVSKTCSRR
jgi:hypothetical protein